MGPRRTSFGPHHIDLGAFRAIVSHSVVPSPNSRTYARYLLDYCCDVCEECGSLRQDHQLAVSGECRGRGNRAEENLSEQGAFRIPHLRKHKTLCLSLKLGFISTVRDSPMFHFRIRLRRCWQHRAGPRQQATPISTYANTLQLVQALVLGSTS